MQDPLPARAALVTLGTLQLLMLGALYTQTAPHPPLEVAPFALAPFLSAAIATCTAAFVMAARPRTGALLALIACAMALVSFGPQKYLDPAFSRIYPAVLCAQIAIAALAIEAIRALRDAGQRTCPA